VAGTLFAMEAIESNRDTSNSYITAATAWTDVTKIQFQKAIHCTSIGR
jgi:hypothetical protein